MSKLRRRLLCGSSGGNPIPLIPNMTDYNTPTPFVASASSEYVDGPYEYRAYIPFSDNKPVTGWLSAYNGGAGSYLQIDMGNSYHVTEVKYKLFLNGAGSNTMKVQISNDGINFTDYESIETSGSGISNEVTVQINNACRYIRITGVRRFTVRFYGVHEMQVYGW